MNGASSLTVVGAGPAGLWLAVRAVAAGWPSTRVQVLSRGWGSWSLHPGTIDISADEGQLTAVLAGQATAALWGQDHPYVRLRASDWQRAQTLWQQELAAVGLPYVARTPSGNFWLPTILGTAHPAWLAPLSLVAGDLSRSEPMLLVGFDQYRPVRVEWIAASLRRWCQLRGETGWVVPRQIIPLEAPTHSLLAAVGRASPRLDGAYPQFSVSAWGRLWERPDTWSWFTDWLGRQPAFRQLGKEVRMVLPLLGWEHTEPARRQLAESLGCPVGELLGGLPAPAGVRLGQALQRRLNQLGSEYTLGRWVQQVAASSGSSSSSSSLGQPQGWRWRLTGTVEETGELFMRACTDLVWAGGWGQPAPVVGDATGDLGATNGLLTVGEAGLRDTGMLRPGSRTGTLLASVEAAWVNWAATGDWRQVATAQP